MKKASITLTIILFSFFTTLQSQVPCNDVNNDNICDFSEFIHIDQFGYLTDANKVAVISNPQIGFNANLNFTPSSTLEIRDAANDALVFSGNIQIWNNGNTHDQSGDKGWWFDFSNVNTAGEYFVYDPSNEVRSSNFNIGNNVYDEVIKAATKMYYYNRCNAPKTAPYANPKWTDGTNFTNPLQDANCRFVDDQNNASLEKDLTGGWFDAGDYNKYVTFTHTVMHNLLWAYEENPNIFGDDWNIPESGNGIPDILDEIKWELDWLLKMTNADGSVHIKMGSISYNDNVAAPPSANTDPRYYGPVCTSASINNASVFAHAARVFQQYSSTAAYANTLETNAINAWNYALPHLNNNTLDTECDDGTIKAGDADWSETVQKEKAVGAAVYLFELTNDNAFDQYVANHINDTEHISTGYWSQYKAPTTDALLRYTTLSSANNSTKNTIQNSISTHANNNWESLYGFNDLDLYRSYMPSYSYHWGSNSPKAGAGVLNLQLAKYDVSPSSSTDYKNKAAEQIHYFHGVNPMGLVHLSNMYDFGGDRCVNEIYHTWFNDGTNWDNAQTSLYGPAPGFLSGGANQDFSVTALTPPAGQPAQKSYLDFNDGFPNSSWEISEPAIYYQAYYLRLLANQIGQANITPLPIELVNYNIEITNEDKVKISWRSASELNNVFFQIERSQDGSRFDALKKMEGAGTTSTGNNYMFIDEVPLEGLSYYRIKQVDTDGSFSYFPTRSVFLENKKMNIQISPNPATEKISLIIDSKISETINISLISISGKTIFSKNNINIQKGKNTTTHSVTMFSRGLYFLKIENIKTESRIMKKLILE